MWAWDSYVAEPVLELNFFSCVVLCLPLAVVFVCRSLEVDLAFVVKGFAFFSVSTSVAFCAWITFSVAGTSVEAPLEVLLVVFASMGRLGSYMAVLCTIGSRWRFIVYTAAVAVLSLVTNSLALLMPLSDNLFVGLGVATAVGAVARASAAWFFTTEATGILRTAREADLMTLTQVLVASDLKADQFHVASKV